MIISNVMTQNLKHQPYGTLQTIIYSLPKFIKFNDKTAYLEIRGSDNYFTGAYWIYGEEDSILTKHLEFRGTLYECLVGLFVQLKPDLPKKLNCIFQEEYLKAVVNSLMPKFNNTYFNLSCKDTEIIGDYFNYSHSFSIEDASDLANFLINAYLATKKDYNYFQPKNDYLT